VFTLPSVARCRRPLATVIRFSLTVAALLLAVGEVLAAPLFHSPLRIFPGITGPTDLKAVDLDGDGAPELVVVSQATNEVRIYRNDGFAGFSLLSIVPLAGGPRRVAAADIDRDGQADLVVLLAELPQLVVFQGIGGGEFLEHRRIDLPGLVTDLAALDMNDDGFTDLMALSTEAGRVHRFRTQAGFTFVTQADLSVEPRPVQIVAADMDRNRRPELIVALEDGTIVGYPGLALGELGEPARVDTGIRFPLRLALADGFGDGSLRIFVGNSHSITLVYPTRWLPLGLASRPVISGRNGVKFFLAADVVGDRRAELLLSEAVEVNPQLSTFSLDDREQYASVSWAPSGFAPRVGLTVDLNRDGRLDAVVADGERGELFVFTSLTESPRPEWNIQFRYPGGLSLADLTGDGLPEILATTTTFTFDANHLPVPRASMFAIRRMASGEFTSTGLGGAPCCIGALLAGDLNGDGRAEPVFMFNAERSVYVRWVPPGGSTVVNQLLARGKPHSPMALGDFDDNGHVDIVTRGATARSLSFLLNEGGGRIVEGYDLTTLGDVTHLIPADVDGDGWPDLVCLTRDASSGVEIYMNRHSGPLRRAAVLETDGEVTAGDFDGDGRLDLASLFGRVWLGNGDGTFRLLSQSGFDAGGGPSSADRDIPTLGLRESGSIAGTAAVASRLTSGDFNGDGLDDLARGWSLSVQVHLSRGDGTFAEPQLYGGGLQVYPIQAADMNGDGRDDIVARGNLSGISILYSTGATTPTPVSWLHSRLARVDGGGVMLSWDVPPDARASAFSILRSVDDGEREILTPRPLSGLARYEFLDAAPPAGRLRYWIEELTRTGAVETHGPFELEEGAAAPGDRPVLHAVHPNPFRGTTRLSFTLAEGGAATLTVHDVAGRRVATLLDGALPPGRHTAAWDGAGDAGAPLPSGLYFLRLETPTGAVTRKIVRTR
jgi:hypothetical protein